MKRSDLIELIREEVEKAVNERELTDKEEDKKDTFVRKMKDSIPDFKRNYGDDWKSVMYAVATKHAKKKGKKS